MRAGGNETAGNTHGAGAHCSKGTGTISSVCGGEVLKQTGSGIGSFGQLPSTLRQEARVGREERWELEVATGEMFVFQ